MSFKKIFGIILILSLVASVTPSIGYAGPNQSNTLKFVESSGDYETQGNRVKISPWDEDGIVDMTLGQTAYTQVGWVTCSKGLVNDGIQASNFKVIVYKNSNIIQKIAGKTSKSKWGSAAQWTGTISTADCIWPAPSLWIRIWKFANYSFDKAGTYEVSFSWYLNQPVIDGFDLYGGGIEGGEPDGFADYYEGQQLSTIITVNVTK